MHRIKENENHSMFHVVTGFGVPLPNLLKVALESVFVYYKN